MQNRSILSRIIWQGVKQDLRNQGIPMTETEKNRLLTTWLIANAKTRLFLARSREPANSQPTIGDVSFLPLAAKGKRNKESVTLISKDYNFTMQFSQHADRVTCQVQAKGYAAVTAVANRQVRLNFTDVSEFLLTFDAAGYAEINLPASSGNDIDDDTDDDTDIGSGQAWHVLPATLTII